MISESSGRGSDQAMAHSVLAMLITAHISQTGQSIAGDVLGSPPKRRQVHRILE